MHPYGVVAHSGRWYVTAVDLPAGEDRIFRLDRITGVRTLSGSFEPPLGIDPAERVLTGLATVPYRYEVILRIQGTVEQIRARLPASVAIVTELPAAGGADPVTERWWRVELRVDRLDWLPAALASLDCPFAIERPDELGSLVEVFAERLADSARRRLPPYAEEPVHRRADRPSGDPERAKCTGALRRAVSRDTQGAPRVLRFLAERSGNLCHLVGGIVAACAHSGQRTLLLEEAEDYWRWTMSGVFGCRGRGRHRQTGPAAPPEPTARALWVSADGSGLLICGTCTGDPPGTGEWRGWPRTVRSPLTPAVADGLRRHSVTRSTHTMAARRGRCRARSVTPAAGTGEPRLDGGGQPGPFGGGVRRAVASRRRAPWGFSRTIVPMGCR